MGSLYPSQGRPRGAVRSWRPGVLVGRGTVGVPNTITHVASLSKLVLCAESGCGYWNVCVCCGMSECLPNNSRVHIVGQRVLACTSRAAIAVAGRLCRRSSALGSCSRVLEVHCALNYKFRQGGEGGEGGEPRRRKSHRGGRKARRPPQQQPCSQLLKFALVHALAHSCNRLASRVIAALPADSSALD